MKENIKKSKIILLKETDKYVLYGNNKDDYDVIENLAERLSKYLNTKFLLYRDDNIIYTDNEYVLQILKYEGFLSLGEENLILSNKKLKVSFDFLMFEKEDKLEFKKYTFKVQWYYLYSVIYEMLYFYLKNVFHPVFNSDSSIEKNGEKLYNLFVSNKEFVDNNDWINKFDELESIDPLHLFISFNYSKQNYDKRVKRIEIMLNILYEKYRNANVINFYSLIKDVKEKGINFDGCPMPMAASILSARNKEDQEIIIENFFKFESDEEIDFSKIKEVYGVDIPSFTIFMFWCKPLKYLSLDKNNQLLLEKFNKLKKLPTNYQEYKILLDGDKKLLYVNISKLAINIKKIEQFSKYEREEIKQYFGLFKLGGFKLESNFEIIALKILPGSSKKYTKNLIENHFYIFNNNYYVDNEKIEKKKEQLYKLYNNDNINITINAIVGKNGVGKSTIIEVIYGMIYNFAVINKITNKMLELEQIELYTELIFKHNGIYKIRILENKIMKVYKFINNRWDNISENFNINEFFYTIGINYSIYGNNSEILGDWIEKLFHKNDAYQTPIVLEPFREKGNIDINNQNKLAKQRLLINLLKQSNENDEFSLRRLRDTEENAFATEVTLTFNNDKIIENKEIKIKDNIIYSDKQSILKYEDIKNANKILECLFKKFKIKEYINIDFDKFDKKVDDLSFEEKIYLYVLKKIVVIVNRYEEYKSYSDFDFSKINNLINKLYKDNSHITFKLKRALYYLKYKLFDFKEKFSFNIEEQSEKLDKFLANNKNIQFHQITPPSFFNIKIFLNDINFDNLSSGEKQRIYFINSLIYHIENINSSVQKYKYKYINIVLDEIELYYHPEFQRQHIKYLLHNLEKANTDNIFVINIIFITHSPFILTDIPKNNILFLKDKKDEIHMEEFQTFGANIYDIFDKGMFLENSIGSFSEEWIKAIDLILSFFNAYKLAENGNIFPLRNLLNYNENDDLLKKDKLELLEELFNNKRLNFNKYKFLINDKGVSKEIEGYINLIGDEVIRKHLMNLYESIENESE